MPYAFLLLLTELLFLFVSLPLYLIVSPKKLQESGFIFPSKEKEPAHFQVYIARRKISLAAIFTAGGIFLLKFIFIGLVSAYLLGAQALLAAAQNWDFSAAGDYAYTAGKIEITGGVARLKDQGTGGSCSGAATACNTFVTSPACAAQAGCLWGGGAAGSSPAWSTAWGTYADWESGGNASGSSPATGGNPTNYKDIAITRNSGAQTASGYWQQSFVTTAANPETAAIKFDWSIKSYNGTYLTSYIIYVFVDNFSGAPTIGNQVWSQTISGTTGWATVSNVNVASKLTAAGTYYIKLLARRIKPAGNPPNVNNTVGWDNVSLTWSKNNSCSGTATACNTFIASPACAAQSGCIWNTVPVYPTDSPAIYPNTSLAPAGATSWNSFIETATKNGGSINYQLSSDDGAAWKYWNGSAWAAAATSANSNSALIINTNISLFPAAAGKIMWKAFLVSNGSQQIILDNIAIGYTQNAAPNVQNLNASQNTTSGYAHINYTLQDDNSDPSSLANYEYSLTGAFAGEQAAMTPVPGDPAHSGIIGLSSSPAGIAHAFVWNAKADLGNIYSNTVYVRLRANDGIADSSYAISPVFSADYVLPVVSIATAAQIPASANIQIGYNLFDNTADNILVELQVSSDKGSTWTVPVASVSGDIGSSVSSGNSKIIIWQAGVDFADQEQDNMMVRVRAKDKYQNQGIYVNSASFVIDNRAPVVAAPANLLAQPLAGATAVLAGGSFFEGNPNTNNFYIALNGGSYGLAEAGDADTATPSDKNVSVSTVLKGNDYISAVKIEHTDDFGQMTVNENTSPNPAYKYIKPYTPPAPTISNPGESSLDVTVNKHSDEADGLEYVIFENSQSLYAQSDGSLGSSPYWQAMGTIAVTGLSQPISQYSFKVKSRNVSDSSHAALSESDFSSGASSDYQSPQIVINSVAQTLDGTKYAVINYTGADFQNQSNNLVKYEYSLNGADWQTMTEKSGAGSDGVAGLAFISSGASLVFAWDVGIDLPGVEDSSVYARLESNDSIANSNIAVSPAFVVNTAGPVVSNVQAIQTPGIGDAVITYDLSDGAGANNAVAMSVSDDSGATYNVLSPSTSGDVGNGITAGLARSIVWNANADFVGQEKNTMRVKITATDKYGNQGSPVESADFSADAKAPVISDVIAAQSSGSALVVVAYNLADLSPADVEFEVSNDSGASWNVATSTYSGDAGLGQTAGAKTFDWNAAADFPDQESATMRIHVRATDNFAHQSAYQPSSDFSLNTKVLSISNIAAEQNLGAKTVTIHYDLNKTAKINLDISSDGGAAWTVATTTLAGQIGDGIAAGNNKTITWNAGADFNNEEKSAMRARLSGLDAFGTLSPYYESADFSADTAAPLGLLSLSKFASASDSVTMNWSPNITDAHFNHYELWHGANQNDVISRSGAAVKWSVADDANLNTMTAISTVITGINLTGDYYVKIWAIDDYGNEAAAADLNVFEETPAAAPSISVSGGSGPALPADTTPPGKPILSPLASPTNITSINIFGLAEAGSKIDLYDNGVLVQRLNNAADNNGQFSQTFIFSEGEHVLSVKAVDSSANASEFSDSVNLKIKTALPSAPIVLSLKSGDSIAEETPVLIGVSEPLSQIEITLDGKNKFIAAANADGAWQFKLPADFALKEGAHSFALIAIDQAGNKSAETILDLNKVVLPEAISAPLPAAPIVRENAEAVELAGVPIPTVANINTAAANDVFTFTGTALPNQYVIVYVHSDQALIYNTKANDKGVWKISHSQDLVELSPGEHTIFAVAVDPSAKVKSQPSPISTFTVSKNFWVSLFDRLNLQTTAISLTAILLTMFWLYRIKKRETAIA